MVSQQEIEKRVLKRITPNQKEKKTIQEISLELLFKIQNELKKRLISAVPQLVGSVSKDTFLRNNLDIDIFILFPTSYPKQYLAKHTLSIGRKILNKPEECYAEHPYIRGTYKDQKVEIVPCYKINYASQKISAVDRTPLHTKFIKTQLLHKQKKDVRLLKQFLRGIDCYGAETEIEGFSGYLCELLIIKYKTFHNFINSATTWKSQTTIALTKINNISFSSPLIFIDPVDEKRNVASALSREKYNLFIHACKDYLKNPKMTFFFPKNIDLWSIERIRKILEKKDSLFIGIIITKPPIISENLYPQIRKGIRSIKDASERYGFSIKDIKFYIDDMNNKIYFIIKTEKTSLPEVQTHIGPPLELKQNAIAFQKKWNTAKRVFHSPYEKNGRLFVDIHRRYTKIQDFLQNKIKTLSMGKDIDNYIQKGYVIVEMRDLLIAPLRIFWTQYLEKKFPWNR